MSAFDAISQMVDLDDDVTITEAVVLVSYLDPEGEAGLGYACLGDGLRTSYLGLLAWAQVDIASDINEEGE